MQLVKGQILPQTKNTPQLGPPFLKWHKYTLKTSQTKQVRIGTLQTNKISLNDTANTIKKNTYIKAIPKNIPQKPSNHNQLHSNTKRINKCPFQLPPGVSDAKWPRHSCYSPGRLAHPDLWPSQDVGGWSCEWKSGDPSPSSAPAGMYEKKFKSSSFSMVPDDSKHQHIIKPYQTYSNIILLWW